MNYGLFPQRRLHMGCGLVVSLAVIAPALPAQQPHLSPSALGQIADEVLNQLVPQSGSLSRVPIAQRQIVFDFQRTMAAFARVGTPAASFRDLHMRRPVELGTRDLLDDCSQGRAPKHPCARLGWRVYAVIVPVSMTSSELVVRATFMWPDRGAARLQHGVTPTGRATLVGFSSEVYLVRTPTGEWKFSKLGTTAVG